MAVAEMGAAQVVHARIINPGALEPGLPAHAVGVGHVVPGLVDQHHVQQVGRLIQPPRGGEGRGADRDQPLIDQPPRHLAGIGAFAVAQGHVGLAVRQVGDAVLGEDDQVEIRIFLAEAMQARRQPFAGQRRQGGDAQLARTTRPHGLQRAFQPLEGVGHALSQALAVGGQAHRTVEAIEQAQAQPHLQRLHMAADGAGGDAQLLGRLAETAEAGGCVERPKRHQRRGRATLAHLRVRAGGGSRRRRSAADGPGPARPRSSDAGDRCGFPGCGW